MINYTQLKATYFSYLTPAEQKDPSILERVDRYVMRDLTWLHKQIKKDATEAIICGKRRVIRDFVGSAKQLLRVLNLNK